MCAKCHIGTEKYKVSEVIFFFGQTDKESKSEIWKKEQKKKKSLFLEGGGGGGGGGDKVIEFLVT